MFCVLVLIGLAEGIVSIMTVSYACQVLSEPYETCMTSEHVVIATPSNVQVPENQPTMTAPKNPELKAMEKARIEKLFPEKTRLYLSSWQLILAGLAGLTQLVLFFYADWGIALTGMGIWSGLFFGIAGGVGLMTVQTPSRRTIAAFLTMNIFACIFAVALITTSWVGLEQTHRHHYSFGKVSFFIAIIFPFL